MKCFSCYSKYDAFGGGTSVAESHHQAVNEIKALFKEHSIEKATMLANLIHLDRCFSFSNKDSILPIINKDTTIKNWSSKII